MTKANSAANPARPTAWRLGVLACLAGANVILAASSHPVLADDVNHTGQSKDQSGSGPSSPGNPSKDNAPTLPGDQPQTQGVRSNGENIDQKKLAGEKSLPEKTGN
jgi:hypothetical protein